MRPVERIPLVLGALERRWERSPDISLGGLLLEATAELGGEPHPLFGASDSELVEVLGGEPQADGGDPKAALLDAIEAAWRREPDQRLAQLLVNVYRSKHHCDPHWFFNTEDGVLLRFLGPLSEDAERYAREEPAARRRNRRMGQ